MPFVVANSMANGRSLGKPHSSYSRSTNLAATTHVNLNSSSLPRSLMGSQSTAKTIFLLISMVGWLIVGASLMYLTPLLADLVVSSDLTHLWMTNLSRGGYNPMLAWVGGGAALAATVVGNIIWYQRFDGKL
ncbi:hypothetical protein ACN4EK_28520 [Pantanalinema rosaneae CENA516]|uniref:hypothetical protein n=1 Tax=Pantanalinema rosaneae TaxID=1620701 RepID=UPI003D6F533B